MQVQVSTDNHVEGGEKLTDNSSFAITCPRPAYSGADGDGDTTIDQDD